MNTSLYAAFDYLLGFIEIMIFVRVIISWLPISRDNQLIRIIYQLTEPVLGPIRALIERLLSGRHMMIDFSPFVALLLIQFIRAMLPY